MGQFKVTKTKCLGQKYTDCNINWRDGQRNNVVNDVDMSGLRAQWQNDPYKNQHREKDKNA